MMRILSLLFLIFTLGAAQADWTKLDHTSVRMVSEYQAIDGKTPFWLLIEFKIQPQWHTYWRNPGDSGLAPRFTLNMPEGFKASSVDFLAPKRIPTGTYINYGYTDCAYHLIKVQPSETINAAIIPIELDASWLVCDKECIPEKSVLTLNLQKATRNIPSADFDTINILIAKTRLPKLDATAHIKNGKLQLSFDSTLKGDAYFFPNLKGLIEPSQAQTQAINNKVTQLSMQSGSLSPQYPIKGILQLKHKDEINNYAVSASFMAPIENNFLPLLLLFALLGGLILNLMPCVFPVLSLKILALKSATNKRLQGIFYTLGVVATFALIATIMIVLQSFGNTIGWGFQLQSPFFNIGLIFLFTLIALNLFGFFEIPFSMSTNVGWQKNHKYLYSFATGVLACVVATPCSAPFMATAVGVALTKPPLVSLLIFVFLGIGLALPYLLVCFIPAFAKLLPRPGAWMETVRQLLAFPMLLSVIWLLWVLGQQIAFDAITLILLSLCALLFSFWLKLRLQHSRFLVLWLIVCSALVLYPIYTVYHKQMLQQHESMPYEVFSQEKLAQLQKNHEKVFVYATAAWCITCKVNEKIALDTKEVQQFFKKHTIRVLKADWTNRDDAILRYLQSFGRAGVPLYVYYAPEASPVVLPQLLTPDLIINSIKKTQPSPALEIN